MKVKDVVTIVDSIQVQISVGGSRFTNDSLVIPAGSKVQIYDIFQGEAKIQQLESPFIETWVDLSDLEANIKK